MWWYDIKAAKKVKRNFKSETHKESSNENKKLFRKSLQDSAEFFQILI
jgi:hypothetical protein